MAKIKGRYEKSKESVSRYLFSARDGKSLAVNFPQFRQILKFPPELAFLKLYVTEVGDDVTVR